MGITVWYIDLSKITTCFPEEHDESRSKATVEEEKLKKAKILAKKYLFRSQTSGSFLSHCHISQRIMSDNIEAYPKIEPDSFSITVR